MKVIYVDVSGSMGFPAAQAVEKFIQSMPDAQVFLFDTEVRPDNGKRFGGGGSELKPVVDHARDIGATEVHVVTDGFLSSPRAPENPEQWTFHIVEIPAGWPLLRLDEDWQGSKSERLPA